MPSLFFGSFFDLSVFSFSLSEELNSFFLCFRLGVILGSILIPSSFERSNFLGFSGSSSSSLEYFFFFLFGFSGLVSGFFSSSSSSSSSSKPGSPCFSGFSSKSSFFFKSSPFSVLTSTLSLSLWSTLLSTNLGSFTQSLQG